VSPTGGPSAGSGAYELAALVISSLRHRSQTLATAESITGGLVGATLTEVPGASAAYRGGLITYATELKATLAAVPPVVLDVDGPVAPTTAAELALAAARVCGADWGIATTGVAGPDAQDGHPVGQVFVAVAGPGDRAQPTVRQLALGGGRAQIRAETVVAVLTLLANALDSLEPG
jgi:nicotinamide-nucleotide amidase